MGFNSSFIYILSKFFYSCYFSFSVLSRTFLSKEQPETLDSSTTVNFLVCLSVFVVGDVLLSSVKVFSSRFLGFVIGGM